MVVESSNKHCLLCGKPFRGRTFVCRECSDKWRGRPIPKSVLATFYARLDEAYPDRSNTHGNWNRPLALLQELQEYDRALAILELGSGGGFLAAELSEMGFTDLTLSDVTVSSLHALRERHPAAKIVAADAQQLPFADASFDLVISSDVMEHLPDLDAHLREVARVLRPGGRYLVKTPNRVPAVAFYRLRKVHDYHIWHPSMVSPGQLTQRAKRLGLTTNLLPVARLTDAQLAKVPGPTSLRRVASRLPLRLLPTSARPHLEAVLTKAFEQLPFTGERVLPDMPEMHVTFMQSLAAYDYAAPFAAGARVLDCGAGEGYGTALLAQTAALVVGMDYDKSVMQYAARKYREAAAFVAADAGQLPFADSTFDLVTCFQVFEHLPQPEAFLREVRRVLAPGGRLLLTTPNKAVVGHKPNPHHEQEFNRAELMAALQVTFPNAEVLGIVPSTQVVAYRARNDAMVRRIMQLDPLGLHQRIPRRWREKLHILLTRVVRRRANTAGPSVVDTITSADFAVAGDQFDQAIDLLAVCVKRDAM